MNNSAPTIHEFILKILLRFYRFMADFVFRNKSWSKLIIVTIKGLFYQIIERRNSVWKDETNIYALVARVVVLKPLIFVNFYMPHFLPKRKEKETRVMTVIEKSMVDMDCKYLIICLEWYYKYFCPNWQLAHHEINV